MQITVPANLPPDELFNSVTTTLGRSVPASYYGNILEVHSDDLTDQEVANIVGAADTLALTDWPYVQTQAAALIQIDVLAEQIRAKYLTSAPLQAATYINKAKDALAYKTAGYTVPFVPTDYPYVDSEMRAAGDTLAQTAADRILTQATQFDSVKGSAIEYERRKGKINVSAALTLADVETARDAAILALQAL